MLEVLVPSRARPQNIERLLSAWKRTVTMPDTRLTVGVDDDDPCLADYQRLAAEDAAINLVISPPLGLAPFTNKLAREIATHADLIGSMGDDHLPLTEGWDAIVHQTLVTHPGVAYANDLYQRRDLATVGFISAELVRRLGYVCPPPLKHYYIDNFWMTLGKATRLTYLPHVLIEHLHPESGKATSDETYERAEENSGMARDRETFDEFVATQWPKDLEKITDFSSASGSGGAQRIVTKEMAPHLQLALQASRFQDAYDIVLGELERVIDAEVLNDIGVLAQRGGKGQDAKYWLLAALVLDPESVFAARNLAAVLRGPAAQ